VNPLDLRILDLFVALLLTIVTEESVSSVELFFSKLSSSIMLPETIQITKKDARIAAVL
jgi:hypothetical protein